MTISAALVVCLTLVIPAATGSMPGLGQPVRRHHTASTSTLGDGRSPVRKSTPTAGGALRSREDGFQAFAVEDDLKISPKKRAAAATPSAARAIRRSAFGCSAFGCSAFGCSARKFAPACGTGRPHGGARRSRRPVCQSLTVRAWAKTIQLKLEAGADPHQAWNDYFNAHAEVPPADVHQTADVVMHKHEICRGRGHDRRSDRSRPGAALDVRGARNRAASGRQPQRGVGAGADVGRSILPAVSRTCSTWLNTWPPADWKSGR